MSRENLIKANFNLFPLKFYLTWDEEGNLLGLQIKWDFSLTSQLSFCKDKRVLKFCKEFLKAFIKYWNFETPFLEIKHKLQGTDLEKRVWKELRKIEVGEVKKYKALAEEIGIPKGYRLIGKILAKNPLPLVYPCHRVIGNKNLWGYSQGFLLKQILLYKEFKLEF